MGYLSSKTHQFDPFVNGLVVILVNFLEFVIFFHLILSIFVSDLHAFLSGGGCVWCSTLPSSAYAPGNKYIEIGLNFLFLSIAPVKGLPFRSDPSIFL